MIGAVAATVAVIGSAAGAGVARQRMGRLRAGGGPEQVWFHIHPPHQYLWDDSPPAAVDIDHDLLDRFTAGLRATCPPVPALCGPVKPADPTQRSYAGLAALTRPPARYLVGVCAADAATAPFAAAGCGLLARRLPGIPAGARTATGTVSVAPLPGWMVGTDEFGVPVTVNLPPGSTVLVSGTSAPCLVDTLPVTGRIIGDDVIVIDSRDATGGDDTVAARWRSAWHPQTCRVILGRTPAPPAGVFVDLTVDVDAGRLLCGEAWIPFRRLPLR